MTTDLHSTAAAEEALRNEWNSDPALGRSQARVRPRPT